jgi:hypothetical protein
MMLFAVACSQPGPGFSNTSAAGTPAPVASPSPSPSPTEEPVVVPDVTGKPEAKAKKVLVRHGFTFEVRERVASMEQPPGWVFAEHPAGSRSVPPGSTVRVDVALATNQWGYNFGCCDVIRSPPSSFCSVFHCVARFGGGTGWVAECGDGLYTKQGGVKGACAKHHGLWRSLLAPPA